MIGFAIENILLKVLMPLAFVFGSIPAFASQDTSDADARRIGCLNRIEAAKKLTTLLMKRRKTDFMYDVHKSIPWLQKNYSALMAKAQPLSPRQTPDYDPTMKRGLRVFGPEIALVADKVAYDFSRQMHFVPGHIYGASWVVLWPYNTDYSGYGENAEIFVSCRGKLMVQPVNVPDYREIGMGFVTVK
ncbi:MAG: hypothetical protein KF789_06280 [Bdellovibrionaceae bacterium]|nr:hypothetical protein [Pseudobdellovibrionaceae bacterium]